MEKYSFWIGYSDMLNKYATVTYLFFFKEQTVKLLLSLSLKVELDFNLLRDTSVLVLIL